MRLALIIVGLAAIAVGLVHIRRTEMAISHERQRLQESARLLRRQWWQQQVNLGRLTAPAEVARRADQMAMKFVPPGEQAPAFRLAAGEATDRRR